MISFAPSISLFLFPLPDSWSPFLSHYLKKASPFPIPIPFHSIARPLFLVRNISHYLFAYIHTPRDGHKKKSPLSPTPLHPKKKKVLKVKSSSPPDSTHLPPQVTYSFFPLSADLPFSSTPHSHSHHSPLLPQQSE